MQQIYGILERAQEQLIIRIKRSTIELVAQLNSEIHLN